MWWGEPSDEGPYGRGGLNSSFGWLLLCFHRSVLAIAEAAPRTLVSTPNALGAGWALYSFTKALVFTLEVPRAVLVKVESEGKVSCEHIHGLGHAAFRLTFRLPAGFRTRRACQPASSDGTCRLQPKAPFRLKAGGPATFRANFGRVASRILG